MTSDDPPIGEFELIDRYFVRRAVARKAPARPGAAGDGVVLGIGDDAALLRLPPDTDLVAAVDTIVEGRHFLTGASAHAIGHRALAVNLSDLAAMGATPAWATLALTLPRADAHWLEGFASGLRALADTHGVVLVGGDTTGGALTVSVQLLGHVRRGSGLRRSGARAGDVLVVTGTLGDAGAGLAALMAAATVVATGDAVPASRGAAAAAAARAVLIARFEYPVPRVQFGLAACGIASAAMDLSDGLVGDLPKLAAASGLAAWVAVETLPLSRELLATASPAQAREWALAAGDDYELLLAVAPGQLSALAAAAEQLDLKLTTIGELRPGNGVTWTLHGEKFAPASRGYDHFR